MPLVLQGELAREKEAKAMEVERHRREREQHEKAVEAEKQRLREAYLRCDPAVLLGCLMCLLKIQQLSDDSDVDIA